MLIAALMALPCATTAQPYPSKPVHLVVPYSPGSTPDIVGRTLANKLQEVLGQPLVVQLLPEGNSMTEIHQRN